MHHKHVIQCDSEQGYASQTRDSMRFGTRLCSEHIIRNSIEKRTYAKEKQTQRKFFEKTLCDKQTQVLRTQERKIATLSPACQTQELRTEGRKTTTLSVLKDVEMRKRETTTGSLESPKDGRHIENCET